MKSTILNLKVKLGLLLIVIISFFLYFLGKQIPQATIQNFLQQFGPWAPVVFILVHQITYIFAPISGIPFLIVGFYLFGKTTIIYSYIAATLGITVNFLIARRWGRPLVAKFVGREALVKIGQLAEEYGLVMLIVLRTLQGGLADFVSYAYGLTNIKFSTYMIVSILAPIPVQAIWYFLAEKANSVEQFFLVTGIIVVIATITFIGINYLLRKRRQKYTSEVSI